MTALAVVSSISPASAEPLPYGPDTCIQGLVWREARPGDTVCVTPAVRDQVATQNANPGSNKDPLAGSGPLSCSQGFVWREAFDGDTICVPSAFRQQMWDANAAAQSNYQRNQAPAAPAEKHEVVLSLAGTGKVMTIDTDPASERLYDVDLPFTQTLRLDTVPDLLQIVAVGGDNVSCQIQVDGVTVASQPPGGSGHCIYAR
ncbi:hypothetical protein [Mycobacterium sp. MS1601]|uniref:hypothetical protein n=1 Tax=Mycobacterium sp. MS1601 TaxID=1936029 RepID=UPI001F42D438|nr:hypothetical protein [Mycobacterium sp. MS1601]